MRSGFVAPLAGRVVALTTIAWLSMLGVDFLVHGGLLAGLYSQPSPFLLPLTMLRSVEAVQQAALIWILPFVFVSSAFVPVSTLPDWLRIFAEHQPVSLIMDAVRGLLLDKLDFATIGLALAWCVGLLVVFIPLAVWAYGHRTAR